LDVQLAVRGLGENSRRVLVVSRWLLLQEVDELRERLGCGGKRLDLLVRDPGEVDALMV
jgi:hypothetical protein